MRLSNDRSVEKDRKGSPNVTGYPGPEERQGPYVDVQPMLKSVK